MGLNDTFVEELDDKIIKEIKGYILDGCYPEDAAVLAGVKVEQFNEWLEKAKDKKEDPLYDLLAFEVMRAERESMRQQQRNVLLAGDEGDWKASMEYLKNRFPDRWDRSRERNDAADNDIHIVITTPDGSKID